MEELLTVALAGGLILAGLYVLSWTIVGIVYLCILVCILAMDIFYIIDRLATKFFAWLDRA